MPDEATIRNVITPNEQKLRGVFQLPKPYYIDIYQREYRWKRENVETLLQDIEVRFEQNERNKQIPREIQEDVQLHFDPYFLNTYLTNTTAGTIALVDGQQRLTTILLVLIKLHSILRGIEEDSSYDERTFSSKALQALIYETDDFGDASRFKIHNANRERAFRALIDGTSIVPNDETQLRIAENYRVISSYYDKYLGLSDNPDKYDVTKLTYYIAYLLDRISIVEIKIEKQQNVAMIFEVVNDRGLELKPYEILKGKLLGTLPEKRKDQANELWTGLQNRYFNTTLRHSTDSQVDLDDFFRIFFRAKFADSETEYESFEGSYHYELYRNPKIRDYFKDFKDPALLHRLITTDIRYFAETYLWLRTTYEDEYLIYNKLLDQNQQYLLVLAALGADDANRDTKVTVVAQKFDQLHSLVRLLDIYDSNAFQRLVYPLVKEIRNRPVAEIKTAFDSALIGHFESQELIPEGQLKSVSDIFSENRFLPVRNRWPTFSKYVLMRIDRHLSQALDKPSYAGTDTKQLEEHFNKSGRRRHGMHLEHIYAFNDSNKALFLNAEGEFDDQLFNSTRNLLGLVLLLKDSQNLSSGNEIYRDKIGTYSKSNFIWNELLAGHLHGVDMRNVPEGLRDAEIAPDESGAFPNDRVLDRQRLVFRAIKKIWCDAVQ